VDRAEKNNRTTLAYIVKDFKRYRYVYLMALPVLAWYGIFCYWPIYGAQIAFKAFNPGLGIGGSPWIGLENFRIFFNGIYFIRTFMNTVLLSIYSILYGFPIPIVFALLLNEVRREWFKRTIQTVSYLPHFISLVVVCSLIREFTISTGLINNIMEVFGFERRSLLLEPGLFRTIYVTSGIWQSMGWSAIIYLAALSGVDPTYYDAAAVDGAGRFRRMLNVTLPGIAPTIIIMFILRVGQLMSVGFEKIILLYNPSIYETADVISSYVYRKGLLEQSYSYSSAVGLFNSAVNFVLVVGTNYMSRRLSETSLW